MADRIRVNVVMRGGVAVGAFELDKDARVSDLKKLIHVKKPKMYPARQGLTVELNHDRVMLLDEHPLSKYEIKNGSEITLKDLGAQLAFRTVYIIEYLGPLFLYPLFVVPAVRSVIYGDSRTPLTSVQLIACFLWCVHFSKRILETIFIHEFGSLTMPVFNVFKNSGYYYGFGLLCGWVVNKPMLSVPPMYQIYIGFPFFCLFMFTNFICHYQLSCLRKPGSAELVLPRGFLFEYLTAPNYVAEIMTWVGFNILTGFTWAGILFNLCGLYQMHQWAREKHLRYQKLFKNYPRQRKILIPFVY